jgi:hypothetical protein
VFVSNALTAASASRLALTNGKEIAPADACNALHSLAEAAKTLGLVAG